jgi:hypothetical protein
MNKSEKLTKSLKEFFNGFKFEPIPGANNTFSGFRNRWVTFYPGFHKMSFYVEKQNFDVNWEPYDRRLHVTFSFIWGKFYIYLPFFKTEFDHTLEAYNKPVYGFYFYAIYSKFPTQLWILYGKNKRKVIHMPWELEWYRTSILMKDNTWETETYKYENRKDFWREEWKDKIFLEQYYYTHRPKNGRVQNTIANVSVSEREWRPRWFMWTKLFAKVVKKIEVEFEHPIGKGSKGGYTGCDFEMLLGESPKDCLKRMENEKNFN